MKQLLFSSLSLLFIITSCSKTDEDLDYRSPFTGSYHFESTISYFEGASNIHELDSINYTRAIMLSSVSNQIIINYSENNSIELILNQDSTLSGFPQCHADLCDGRFNVDKSISFS